MKIYCSRNDMNKALANVSHSVPVRSTSNILEGILVEVSDNVMKLTATDTNMTIESSMSEETEEKIKNDLRNAAKDAAVHTVKKAKAAAESAKAALEDVKKAVEDAKPEIDKAKDEAVSFIHEVIEEVKKDEQ